MTSAFWGSWNEWERTSAFILEVFMLRTHNLDFSEFTIMLKTGSSLEKFRMVWVIEKGEENYIDERIIKSLIEILHFIYILSWAGRRPWIIIYIVPSLFIYQSCNSFEVIFKLAWRLHVKLKGNNFFKSFLSIPSFFMLLIIS